MGCVLNTAELPTLGVLQDQNLWEGWLREASSYNTRGFANGLRNLSYTLSVSSFATLSYTRCSSSWRGWSSGSGVFRSTAIGLAAPEVDPSGTTPGLIGSPMAVPSVVSGVWFNHPRGRFGGDEVATPSIRKRHGSLNLPPSPKEVLQVIHMFLG